MYTLQTCMSFLIGLFEVDEIVEEYEDLGDDDLDLEFDE